MLAFKMGSVILMWISGSHSFWNNFSLSQIFFCYLVVLTKCFRTRSPSTVPSFSYYLYDRLTNVHTRAKIMITYLSRFGLSSELSSFINDGCKLNRRLKCFPIISICWCTMRLCSNKYYFIYTSMYIWIFISMDVWMFKCEWMAHANSINKFAFVAIFDLYYKLLLDSFDYIYSIRINILLPHRSKRSDSHSLFNWPLFFSRVLSIFMLCFCLLSVVVWCFLSSFEWNFISGR